MVNRGDCAEFRPAPDCPVFSAELGRAVRAGVVVLAARVQWSDSGEASFTGTIPVNL